MATQIGTLGNIDELNIGGRIITNVPSPNNTSSELITLCAHVSGNGLYSTLRKVNATSGYQVTAGKTFTIIALQIICSAAGSTVSLGYGTADAGFNGAAPAGAVFMGGSNSVYVANITAVGVFYAAPNFPTPATDYPFVFNNTSGADSTVIAYGYEA